MTKYITLLIFLPVVIFSNDFEKDQSLIQNLRITYYDAVEKDNLIDTLESIIFNNFGEDELKYPPLILAYKAGAEALKSKHAFWPFVKMSKLNDSMDLFRVAVSQDPDNLEIRFMRYSILYYVPGVLGYDDVEDLDKAKIIDLIQEEKYANLENSITKGIIEFMLRTDQLDVVQTKILNDKIELAFDE